MASYTAPSHKLLYGRPQDLIEQTVTAGSSSLSYDASSGQYTYAWKTDRGWFGTCRRLDLGLNDGSQHQAYL
jgi:hypothetical protein